MVYRAEIYADGANANWKTNPEEEISEKEVNSKSILTIKLAAGGGQICTNKLIIGIIE
jgi:alpha-glucosidase